MTAAASLLTMAAKMRAQWPVSLRVRHGSQSVVAACSFGGKLTWPYDGSANPPVGRVFWLPVPVTISGVSYRPREGTILERSATFQTYELVPFGDEPPARLVDTEGVWKCHALETTHRPRRDTLVDIEVPDPDATRAASGNKARTYVVDDDDVPCTLEAEAAGEEVRGSKLVQVRRFTVKLAARIVHASARLRIKSGWLRDEFAARTPDDPGPYLYVKGVSRASAAALETVLVCESAGG